MAPVSHDGLNFPGLAWTFKLLPNKCTQASILHPRPWRTGQPNIKIQIDLDFINCTEMAPDYTTWCA